MPIEITMPRLSDTMEEGTLVTWKVAVGDKVSSGDVIADVETDKATMELSTYDDGTVAKLVIGEGDTTTIGSLICVLAGEGESVEDAAAAAGSGSSAASSDTTPAPADSKSESEKSADEKPAPAATSTKTAGNAGENAGGNVGGGGKASPLARKMAEEHGLNLSDIKGTGPDGRVIKRDILAAIDNPASTSTSTAPAAGKSASPAPTMPAGPRVLDDKLVPLSNMRKTIAKRLVESKTTVPHFQVSVAVRMDALMGLRKTINSQLESQGVKLSVNDFITRGVALSCLQHPVINASYTDAGIQYHPTVNVGTAIALPINEDGTGGGLVVATVRDVERKGLRQISEEVKTLAGKSRKTGLTVDEMSDSTITISNLGMPQYGVTQFTAIVNPPNAAIIAVGAAIQKPVIDNGQIVIGLEMNVTLSGDHRVIDGASAAEYLATLRQMLENPAALLV